MKVKALDKQVKSQAKALEDARARVTATDEDFERFRQQTRKTSEGGLQRELFRLGAAKAEAEAQVTHGMFSAPVWVLRCPFGSFRVAVARRFGSFRGRESHGNRDGFAGVVTSHHPILDIKCKAGTGGGVGRCRQITGDYGLV